MGIHPARFALPARLDGSAPRSILNGMLISLYGLSLERPALPAHSLPRQFVEAWHLLPQTALLMAYVTQPPNWPLAGTLKKLLLWAPVVLAGYSAVMLLNLRGAGEKLAGIKLFSQQVNERWQRQYHQQVRFVGGDYLSQWLTFYIDDRPAVITPWSVERRPNIYTRSLRQDRLLHDGVLLLRPRGQNCDEVDFSDIQAPWPALSIGYREEMAFVPHPGAGAVPICLAFVPPMTPE